MPMKAILIGITSNSGLRNNYCEMCVFFCIRRPCEILSRKAQEMGRNVRLMDAEVITVDLAGGC